MSSPYVGEIRIFGGNFAPAGWMFCEGQLLPISENETLFNLIGTTYGGDGRTTFCLPDLRGRVPSGVNAGDDYFYLGVNGVPVPVDPSQTGGPNITPYLALNFIIAVEGTYPARP